MADVSQACRRGRLPDRPAQQPDGAGELCANQRVAAMSDHFSGPRALADPAADLIDLFAFPAPNNPHRPVVVMDAFGKAGPSAVFSDATIYRFRFRRARTA